MEIAIELPDVQLGFLEAEDVKVSPASLELAEEMDTVCARIRGSLTVEEVAELEAVRRVRAMFRAWGMDPSKYRPSSEALLRRVVQGKGLYRISNVVDVCNLCSIEAGWPFGLYDRAHVHPPVAFRHGRDGETYQGIGKQMWHLHERPVMADTEGPFGSPISDSVRTMITDAARAIVTVIYAPAGSAQETVEKSLEQYAKRLEQFTGARVITQRIISGQG
jgi:DNA/RNA-binding domain of Phe-tRNA-synthetase-like protein